MTREAGYIRDECAWLICLFLITEGFRLAVCDIVQTCDVEAIAYAHHINLSPCKNDDIPVLILCAYSVVENEIRLLFENLIYPPYFD